MMNAQQFKQRVKHKIVVSIQPVPNSPLNTEAIIVAMAKAAENAGAPALRIEGVANVAAVCQAVEVPVIGIVKRDFPDFPIRITPLIEDVENLILAGATVVAFDATDRLRPVSRLEILKTIQNAGGLSMADCSCIEDGLWAEQMGVDIIGTTLSGYVSDHLTIPVLPDFDLVRSFAERDLFVMAEGRYNTPELAKQAIAMGASAVTIGSAITRLEVVIEWFLQAVQEVDTKMI